jgi:hypothetical protein
MLGKFLATPLGGAVRIAIGVVLGYVVLDLQTDGTISISFDELVTWVAAALVVSIPLLIAYVNPADTRFGRGSE